MAEQVGHVFYVLEVKQYDNGHCHAYMNFGGPAKVQISADSEREAISKAVEQALSIKWDEPLAPEPMVG